MPESRSNDGIEEIRISTTRSVFSCTIPRITSWPWIIVGKSSSAAKMKPTRNDSSPPFFSLPLLESWTLSRSRRLSRRSASAASMPQPAADARQRVVDRARQALLGHDVGGGAAVVDELGAGVGEGVRRDHQHAVEPRLRVVVLPQAVQVRLRRRLHVARRRDVLGGERGRLAGRRGPGPLLQLAPRLAGELRRRRRGRLGAERVPQLGGTVHDDHPLALDPLHHQECWGRTSSTAVGTER